MKTTLILLFCGLFLSISTQAVLAVTTTPAAGSGTAGPTPTNVPTKVNDQTQAIDQKINDLKNKISNQVDKLKLVEKRGFIGTVTDSTNTTITLTDINGNTQNVDVDEISKFSSADKSDFGISDVKKGMVLEILGLYNKESQHTLARDITIGIEPVYIHGAVSSIDTKHYNINVQTSDNKNVVFSITIGSTKIQDFTKTDGLQTAKFADVVESEHVIATGFWDKTDKNTLNVSHLLLFSELPKDPKITLQVTPTDAVTPSSGSGKKLTPLKPIQ